MRTIENVWFSVNRIFMQTEQGKVYNRPLEAFPLLKHATKAERENFQIGKFKDDIRWEGLDEDIHISSFFSDIEPKQNSIGDFFTKHKEINVSYKQNRHFLQRKLSSLAATPSTMSLIRLYCSPFTISIKLFSFKLPIRYSLLQSWQQKHTSPFEWI